MKESVEKNNKLKKDVESFNAAISDAQALVENYKQKDEEGEGMDAFDVDIEDEK